MFGSGLTVQDSPHVLGLEDFIAVSGDTGWSNCSVPMASTSTESGSGAFNNTVTPVTSWIPD